MAKKAKVKARRALREGGTFTITNISQKGETIALHLRRETGHGPGNEYLLKELKPEELARLVFGGRIAGAEFLNNQVVCLIDGRLRRRRLDLAVEDLAGKRTVLRVSHGARTLIFGSAQKPEED
ncbi:MAG: hypothetical protein WCT37_01855 [Patescibacteria group bacterium]|jgi:hypothetical protein